MATPPLEKSVYLFPIMKYGTKKYIPLIYALPIAYIVPTIFIILLSPFSYNNVLLYQIEYILVALFYGLVGILTRSKLRSLLNIVPAALSYITTQFIVQGLFNLNPPLNDPYAGFNVAATPLANILSNPALTQAGLGSLSSLPSFLFIVDILIIFLLAEIGGFFTAVLSTGFWNPKGQFSVVAVIAKVIVLPIVLIMIIMLPLVLHGVTATLDGTAYIGAGVSELSLALGGGSGGKASQISINNLDINALKTHSQLAAYFFSVANDKFAQLKGNLLLQAVLGYVTSNVKGLNGFQNITNALDLIGSISEVTYVLPELFLGFKALADGFNETIPIITHASTTYNPTFKTGLKQLTFAFDNFSLAWKKSINNQDHGLYYAIEKAMSLQNVDAIKNYVNINEFISALNKSVTILLNIGNSFVQFLNGTYETTIGLANLAQNDLNATNVWMDAAIQEFIQSNGTLGKIAYGNLTSVVFDLYPNGDGGTSGKQEIAIPVDGVVKIAADLNNLLIYFAYAGLSGINLMDSMDLVMTKIGQLNWTDTSTSANATWWHGLSANMNQTNIYFQYGIDNISIAEGKILTYKTHSYGSMLDPVFINGNDSFYGQLYKQIDTLKGNFTDFQKLLYALGNTSSSFEYFSYANANFTIWDNMYNYNYNNSIVPLINSTMNTLGNQSYNYFNLSAQFAHMGYIALTQTIGFNSNVTQTWENSLFVLPGTPPFSSADHSMNHIDNLGMETLTAPTNTPAEQAILLLLSQIHLGSILGS